MMKAKYLIALAAVAGMFTACSDDDLSTGGNITEQVGPNGEPLIKLGFGSASVQTRGTGTVGSTVDSLNVWKGQKFNVYMIKKSIAATGTTTTAINNGMALALFTDPEITTGDKDVAIFDAEEFQAPTDTVIGIATATDGNFDYYPADSAYNFFGYRLDDAYPKGATKFTPVYMPATYTSLKDSITITGNTQAAKNEIRKTASTIVVPFKIDGTQDIMSGKAEATHNDSSKVKNDLFFSASSTRKGVVPNIKFQHHLARLVFRVVPGNPGAAGIDTTNTEGNYVAEYTKAISVDSIKVLGPTEGTLTVAYVDKPDSVCKFNNLGQKDSLTLMQRASGATAADDLVALTPTSLEWVYKAASGDEAKVDSAVTDTLGEAMLVAPGVKTYPMILYLTQEVKKNSTTNSKRGSVFKANIELNKIDGTNAGNFEAGKSYVVTIKVYGMEKITITSELEKWEEGGNINIDMDDYSVVYTPATGGNVEPSKGGSEMNP